MANIEERVEDLVSQTITQLGYELYDVQYAKEGKNYFLRIFIDHPEGIDLEDCEKVNDAIIDLLDEADYIKEQYFLEISSPGIERVLRKDKHLKDNIDQQVNIKLFKPIEGKKELIGILKNFNEENITLFMDEVEKNIPRNTISLIKTIYEW